MTSRTRVLELMLLPVLLVGCAATVPAPSGGPSATAPASVAPTSTSPALTPVPGGPAASGVPGAGMEPTEAEQQLLHGMRLDLRGACGPFRDKLPAGAVGEVLCLPASGEARSVEVAIFEDQDALLAAYFDRLGQAGVPPGAGGSCADGSATESSWLPGPDEGQSQPERGACWIDADKAPAYLATQPPFVLITVTGQPSAAPDTARQYAWAGNEDVPGAPTLWREFPVDAEK